MAVLLIRTGTSLAQFQSPPAQVPVTPATGHVFLIVLENTSYGTMTNSANSTTYMPNLVALGNKYGHTTNYITNSGGSLLAYLWLSSGYCHSDPTSTADCPHPPFPAGVTGLHSFGCTGGACINPTTGNFWPITDDNIYREMINHTPNPIPWKLYAESIPYAGYTGPRTSPPDPSSAYDPHHNGPLWYSDVGRDPAQQQQQLNMVPFTQFATDLQTGQLPQYSIIIPNDNHDAHDGTPKAADDWLQANVFVPLLSQPFFQSSGDGLLIVTFDNDDSDGAGLVYTAVIGPQVKPGYVTNTLFHHEDTLLTILQALGISARPGYTAIAKGFAEFFMGSAPTAVLSTTNMGFANQTVGVATAQTVTLSNTGTAPLVINSISVTAGATDYSQTNDCGNAVPTGSFCTVTVKFTPTTTGLRSGTLTFNDSVTPAQTVSLSGTGVASTQSFTLTVTKQGTGNGTVTSDGGFINCGTTCSAVISGGTLVTLTATPAPGSYFAGWSGACTGTQTCSVTMNAAQSVSATFDLQAPPPPARPAGSVLDTSNALSTSLAGLFVMNEGSGTTDLNLVDKQTASFAGTALPTWNTSDPSVVLNGGGSLNSYLDAGADLTFDQLPVSKMTVVAKVFVNSVAAAGIAEKNDGNIDSGFIFGWDSTGALKLTVEKSTANMRVSSAAGTIVGGQWLQLAFTWDGTVATAATAHLFLNGVEQAKTSSSDGSGTLGFANATNQPFRIGNASFDSMAGALNGKIAYLAVYKGRILSTAELNQLDSKLPIAAASAPAVTLSTTNMGFGNQTVSTAATQTVRLTNSGNASLSITSIAVTAGATDYSQTNDCGSSLAASAFCTVTVKFIPSTTGLRSGTLTFTDSVTPAQTVGLSGTGVAQAFALTVTKQGPGTGTVTSNDGSINCGTTCSASLTSGTVVTLTATPAAGSIFAGWSGASGTQTCTITMSAAQNVTATFNVPVGPPPPPPRPMASVLDTNNPLAASLAGLFVMNESSGSTDLNLVDNQAASFAGTAVPTWNTSDPSIVFNGGSSLNSYVNAGADLTFDQLPINKMTVVAKVFVNTVAAAGIAEKNDGNIDSGFIFGWDSAGALRLTVEKSSLNMRVASASGTVVSGQWMQVAFTWDGTVATAAAAHLFLNGAEQAKTSSADGSGTLGFANATNQPFRIGNAGFDTMAGALNGKIAYLAVYKGRILTSAELNQLDSQLPLGKPDVIATVTPNGPPTTVTTASAGQSIRLTFAGTAGQNASVQITGNTLGAVTVSLLAPNGATVSSMSSSSASFTLPGQILSASGTYTAYVHPNSPATGSVSVAVTLANLPNRAAGAALDSANPLSTNLAGLFLMNEASGTTDKNLVNAGLANFAGSSTPSWNTTDPSVTFKGGSSLGSYLNAGPNLIFDQLPNNKMTIVARVFVTTVAAAGVCEKNDGNIDSGFLFGWDSTGALRLTVEKSTTNMRVASATGTIVSGQWMQVAFTWDGTVATAASAHLFLNGVEQTKTTSADGTGTLGFANATNQPFRIGNASFDTMAGALNGKIGYLAVYKGRILSAAEMNQLDSQLPIH